VSHFQGAAPRRECLLRTFELLFRRRSSTERSLLYTLRYSPFFLFHFPPVQAANTTHVQLRYIIDELFKYYVLR